ncbi:hypothetical protein [Paraburkholderia tropica]|nr:hypothetical protein [Paraburkholderia tropica]
MKWDSDIFIAYDPYATFAISTTRKFITADGESSFKGWSDPFALEEDALWNLGKNAFDALKISSNNDFQEKYADYIDGMRLHREMLSDLHGKGRLVTKNSSGEVIDPEWDKYTPDEILGIGWQIFEGVSEDDTSKNAKELKEHLCRSFLFVCLKMIERTLISYMLDHRGGIYTALSAASAFGNAEALISGDSKLTETRRKQAYDAAMVRVKRDPKQADKARVREYWDKWQKNSDLYKNQAEFARDMLEKFGKENNGSLTSTDTIVKKWIPEFRKSSSS